MTRSTAIRPIDSGQPGDRIRPAAAAGRAAGRTTAGWQRAGQASRATAAVRRSANGRRAKGDQQKGKGQKGGKGGKGQQRPRQGGPGQDEQGREGQQPGESQSERSQQGGAKARPGQRSASQGWTVARPDSKEDRQGPARPAAKSGRSAAGPARPATTAASVRRAAIFAAATGPFEDYVPTDMRGPLTGERFREWSDRLRDVEEMVADPELRAEAARIRERARVDAGRAEAAFDASRTGSWCKSQVAGPLVELRDRVAAELLRRTAKQAIVPLDRDPVPPQILGKDAALLRAAGQRRASREQSMIGRRSGGNHSRRPAMARAGPSAFASSALAASCCGPTRRPSYVVWVRVHCGTAQSGGIVLLAALLVEPLFTGTRPRPGSNLFLVVADNSKSLQLADRGAAPIARRGDEGAHWRSKRRG